MIERVVVVAVLVALAVVFAVILRRLTGPSKPVKAKSWTVPAQLHRGDFANPDAPVLVVLFSSATCDGCAEVWGRVQALEGTGVAVTNVVWQDERELHERYGIDAVPTTVVVDLQGVVQESFVGTVSTLELRSAVRTVS